MDHYYENIQGWFRAQDVMRQVVARAPDDMQVTFVEIGCWKGRSTAFLGVEIINSGKPIKLICIDTFEGTKTELAHKNDPDIANLEEIFAKNIQPLRDAGLDIEYFKMSSVEAAKALIGPFFFCYLDGDHEYHAVVEDIKAWYPKVSHYLMGDDYQLSGVACAVRDCLSNNAIGRDDGQWLVDARSVGKVTFPETQPKRVMIATPTHDCKVWVGYMEALLRECELLNEAGIGCEIPRYDGDSAITRCRNVLAGMFMAATECTHLMWVDSDIVWPTGLVRDLVNQDKAIVAAAYPKKSLPISFVVNPVAQEMDLIDHGFMEVKDAGTGFLLVRRDVMEAIKPLVQKLYPANLSMWEAIPQEDRGRFADHFYNYFGEMTERVDGDPFGECYNWLSEDYAFCRRAQKVGYKVLLAVLAPLAHFGNYCYDGDVASALEVRDGVTLREHVNERIARRK